MPVQLPVISTWGVCEHSHACGDDESYDPTVSEYESMRRAIASLKRAGLVMHWAMTLDVSPRLYVALTREGEDVAAKMAERELSS
jgi:hypothetical protein